MWKIINKDRKRGSRGGEEIKMEQWMSYFATILDGVMGKVIGGEEGEMEGKGGMRLEKEESKKNLQKIKEGKAGGMDGIPGELWKYGGEGMGNTVWEVYNGILNGDF